MPNTDNQRDPQSQKQKGNDAFKRADYPTAIGFYTSAMLLDPTDPTYPLNRAMAYLKLNKFHDALRDSDRALSLSPNNSKALFRRGLAKKGIAQDLDGALKDFESALQQEPKNPSIQSEIQKTLLLISKSNNKQSVIPDLNSKPLGYNVNPDPASTPSTSRLKAAISSVNDSDIGLTAISTRRGPPKQSPSHPVSTSTNPPVLQGEEKIKKSFADVKSSRDAKQAIRRANHLTSSNVPLTSTSVNGPSIGQVNAKVIFSPAEFDKQWNSLRGSSTDNILLKRWHVLNSIDLSTLPGIFGQSLEADTVVDIVQVCEYGSTQGDHEQVIIQVLQQIPRCDRFDFVQMFLNDTDKNRIKALLDAVGLTDVRLRHSWLS